MSLAREPCACVALTDAFEHATHVSLHAGLALEPRLGRRLPVYHLNSTPGEAKYVLT